MSLFEAYTQYRGSKAQERGASKAADLAYYTAQQAREDVKPWREVGGEALYTLEDLLGMEREGRAPSARFGELTRDYEFEKEPGYEFRKREGEKGIERMQAARGDIFSGRGGKELGRYLSDYASGEYGKGYARDMQKKQALYNMLAGLSGTGRVAGSEMGRFGMEGARETGAAEYAKGVGRGDYYRGMGELATKTGQDIAKMIMMGG